uniref:Putative secreted peptide n=1 Tax=Anopheles braziliensis TaxID=58242 RepID=A0A2M3ZNQ5_9DIPT
MIGRFGAGFRISCIFSRVSATMRSARLCSVCFEVVASTVGPGMGITEAMVENRLYHFCIRADGCAKYGPEGTTIMYGWPGSFRFLFVTIGSQGFFRIVPNSSCPTLFCG